MDNESARQLHLAISRRDTNAVKKLLDEGANVNITDQQYRAPLCRAINDVNCSNEIVKLLIGAKCDINAESEGKSPIYYAIQEGNDEVLRLLLARGAIIDNKSKLLHVAANRNDIKACKILIDHGIDVNARDQYERTALYAACSDALCYPDTNKETIQLLIRNGTDLDARDRNGQTALHFAISHGYKKTVKQLLDEGADVDITDKQYRTPLCLAIENGYSDLAELLIKAKCDINAKSKLKSPIYYAIEKSNHDILRLLIARGAIIDNKSKLLHLAARRNDIRACRMLIDLGINVNALDQHCRTALHLAANSKFKCSSDRYEEIIHLLIQNGTYLNARDRYGRTALHYAIKSGADLSYNLFEHDFDIDAQDYNGDTPLHIAARGDQYKVVRLLLYIGCDMNTTNNHGETPLECAIHERDLARPMESSHRPSYYRREHRYIEKFKSVVEIREHIRKLYAAGLYVSKKNLSIVNPEESDPVIVSCGKELKKIRSRKIGNNISLYDALVKCNVPSLGEELIKVLELINYDEEFPLYCELMKNNLKNHKLRSDLISSGIECFYTLNKLKKLPVELVEKILCELGNSDLKNLISCMNYSRIIQILE